jgi:hypothetical protein
MDFKSIISKISSLNDEVKTIAAPVLPQSVQLNEDAQLRVLSGRTTYVAEAKKKAEEDVKEESDMKVGDKKNIATGTVEKTKTGIVHKSSKAYGGSEEKEADDEDDKPKKKAKKESVEPEFKSKFMKMVEAKKDEKKDDKKKKPMKEAAKPDFLDLDGDKNEKETMKQAAADKGDKPAGKKGMSDKQAKYFGKKTESAMMPKGKKRPVKESVETTLSFKQMVQLVQESGGQQQIDPVDKALFTWAERVAQNKLGEGMKADLYAGLVYERNGGVFEMYDVLSESKKKVVESRLQLDEGMLDKVKSAIMSKIIPKLSSSEKSEIADAVKSVLGKDRADKSDFTLANIKAVGKALGAKPDAAAESIEEGPMDMIKGAGKKVSDFFGQTKVDPKSGQGTIGGIDAYHPKATLGEKLSSLGGIVGGIGSLVAAFGFSGPGWLIIPGIIGIMMVSQIGMTKDGSS